jgi:TrwC relaxase
MHKLTAGSGYDYLTRQVAALDSTEKGHAGLASYYTERASHRGVDRSRLGRDRRPDRRRPGDHRADPRLFGCGLHPLAELRQQQLEGPDLPQRDLQDAARLGAPFKIVDSVVSLFRLEVAKRIGAIQTAAGIPAGVPLPATDRARVRTEVARNFFLAAHGREPIDARELAGQIAKDSRPRTQTVAGFDLTFSPVKSVSTLWAVAEPAVAVVIERAH